jgi:hypothetical protein
VSPDRQKRGEKLRAPSRRYGRLAEIEQGKPLGSIAWT